MTHELVGVIVDPTVTRATAQDVVARILAPFEETYSDDDDGAELLGWWDFWSIGGRWTGVWVPGYEPDKDPRNRGDRPCFICGGTGQRADIPTNMTREQYVEWCGGCNGCSGSGWYPPHPSEFFPVDRDVIAVSELIADDTLCTPRRLVLPDSGVICRDDFDGEHSWDPSPEWNAYVRKQLDPYREARIVAVDVHV